jgi:hypothetical protein
MPELYVRIPSDINQSPGSTTLATLIVAVFDGLLMEVMSTGDRRRARKLALHEDGNRAGPAGHIDASILPPQSAARAKLTSAPHQPIIIPGSGPIGTMAQRVWHKGPR